jgi:hypothetical protein
MNPTSPKPSRIDPRTARPDSAYPRQQSDAQRYTHEFSRALGLRPTPTLFGNKVLKI